MSVVTDPRAVTHVAPPRQKFGRRIVAALFGLSMLGAAIGCQASTFGIAGSGSFKVPAETQLTQLPADAPFSRADLASGKIAFTLVLDDSVKDVDADPYVGRYPGAVRQFIVTIGSSTLRMPVAETELSVSDGGQGKPSREAIQVRSQLQAGANVLKVGWVQVNQRASTEDLRGAAGSLASDAMPRAATMANLDSSSRFDRVLVVQLNAASAQGPLLLYLNTSALTVNVADAPSGK